MHTDHTPIVVQALVALTLLILLVQVVLPAAKSSQQHIAILQTIAHEPFSHPSGERRASDTLPSTGTAALTSTQYLPLVIGPTARASVSPAAVSFGEQPNDTTSNPQQVQLISSGSAVLTVTTIYLERWQEFDMLDSSTCPIATPFSLQPAAACIIDVVFYAPTTTGDYTDTLIIASNGRNGFHTLPVQARSVSLALETVPQAVDFGNQSADTTSALQQVTLMSSGTGALTVSSIYLERWEEFNLLESSTCPIATPFALQPGASCTIDMVFYAPASTGTTTDTLVVVSNAADAVRSIPVQGTSVE